MEDFQIQTTESSELRVVVELSDRTASLENLENVEVESRSGRLVQICASISRIKKISVREDVDYIRPPLYAHAPVESEGVGVIRADNLHEAGITGEGVKVAVIDLGFEGYSTNPEVPSGSVIEAKSFRADGDVGAGEVHGTACAEVILDVAPDAKLYLLNFDTSLEFADAVNYAISEGVDVISCSVNWFFGPHDGTGFLCDVVDNARDRGIFFAQSAGNYAKRHYEGGFRDADDDNWHEFSADPRDEFLNLGILPAYSEIKLLLSWDDWPESDQDYDLYLFKGTVSGWEIAASSENPQTGKQQPYESITGTTSSLGSWGVAIKKWDATRDVHFEFYSPPTDLPEHNVESSSLGIPADAEGATAAGATYWENDDLEDFSSRGPTNDGRMKPDVAAPDGVSNYVYGSFSGTSASAPHVAGATALILSGNPLLSVEQVENRLKSGAVDLGPTGDDCQYGTGRIDVLASLLPKEPVLETPHDGELISGPTPSFEWKPGSYADNQELSVDNDKSFSSPEVAVTLGPEAGSYTLRENLQSGTYYWRVIAGNSVGENCSDIRIFTVDATVPAIAIDWPSSGGSIASDNVNVEWTASDNASGIDNFEVRLGETDGWTVLTDNSIDNYNFTGLPEGVNTVYVRAVDCAGNPGEDNVTFTVDTVAPTVSVSVSPAMLSDSETGSNNFAVTLDYTEEMDPYTVPDVSFGRDLYGTLTLSVNTYVDNTWTVTYDVSDENVEVSNVGVIADNAEDLAGNVQVGNTLANAFDVDTKGPDAPTLLTPADGIVMTDNTPTFKWENVGADNYDLRVDNDQDFSSLTVRKRALTDDEYPLQDANALVDDTYHWKVRARNGAGDTTSSGASSFTVDTTAPSVTVQVNPTLIDDDDAGSENFAVTATYGENMDTSDNPSLSFDPDVTQDTLTLADNFWNSAEDVYSWTFDVADADVENGDVAAEVSGGRDYAGNSAETGSATFDVNTKVEVHRLSLDEGWNLMSLPLIPSDDNIEHVLSDDNLSGATTDNVQIVWYYDAVENAWKKYVPGTTIDLKTMEDGKAYWVKMETAATLTVKGSVAGTGAAIPPSYDLQSGWNMVGFKSATSTARDNYLNTAVRDQLQVMWSYDPDTGWSKVKSTTTLEPGKGYWIALDQAATLYP